MINLDAITKSLQIVLTAPITTNQLIWVASYTDASSVTFAATGANEADGTTNSTTAVTMVAAPAANAFRTVKSLQITNADTVSATVKIIFNNNGTLRYDPVFTLAQGDNLFYEDCQGYYIVDKNGNSKISAGGTVSSVAMTGDGVIFNSTVSGSPITSSGTLAPALLTQTANTVLAGPTSGGVVAPTFRALVGADLPNPSATTLGGIESYVAVSNQWINAISTSGVPSSTQPAFTNISGTLAVGQGGTGQTTLTNHGVLIGAATSAITQLAAAAAGTFLTGQGASSDPSFSATPTLGIAGTTKGTLSLAGNTSGVVTVQPAAAAGTWSLTLPTTGGTNTYFLQTNGSGVTTWAAGGGAPGGSDKQIQFNNSSAFGGASALNYDTSTGFFGLGTITSPSLNFDAAYSRTSGGAARIAVTQTQSNTTDTADLALSLNYTISASSASNELVTRVFNQVVTNSLTGGGVVTNMRCYNLNSVTNTSTTITNLEYIYIINSTSSGTVTTGYGIHIAGIQGTTKWGLFDESGANLAVAGSAMFGLASSATAPSAVVHSQQQTLGNEVSRWESVATNTYPSERLFQGRGTTTNNTITTIMTLAMPFADGAYNIEVYIIGRRTGGSSGTTGDSYYAFFRYGFKSISSTLSQITSGVPSTIAPNESNSDVMISPPSSNLDVSSNNLLVRVTGNTNVNYTWHAHVKVRPLVS